MFFHWAWPRYCNDGQKTPRTEINIILRKKPTYPSPIPLHPSIILQSSFRLI